jgi:putative transposase
LGIELQDQPYDHVLKPEEIERTAFEDICEYIARNPERANLVPVDRWMKYEFTGCLMPGYPDLNPFQDGYWELFWSLVSTQRATWSRSPDQ